MKVNSISIKYSYYLMGSYKTPMDYINYLVDNQININIINFVKELNKIKFKIDISFIDEFIELVNKDECCIHHDMLVKYGVITLTAGSHHIKRIIDGHNFKTNEDYRLTTKGEPVRQGDYITQK